MKEQAERKKHWEEIYQSKNPDEVSWYQENPETSINLILSLSLNKKAKIIDVGGGDSILVDKLLDLGFGNISVLDISSKALEKSKKRLGGKAEKVNWICSDIKNLDMNNTIKNFDVWHDRALLHFLTSEKDIEKYIKLVNNLVKPEGYLIISTFSLKGPKKCSGLEIKQYSKESMKKLFRKEFKHIKSFKENHETPFQTTQSFIYNIFKKIKGGDKNDAKIK